MSVLRIAKVNLEDPKILRDNGVDLYIPKSGVGNQIDSLVDKIRTLRQQP